MFEKILKVMDFMPNYKTLVSAVALIISAALTARGIDVASVELSELLWKIFDNLYVIISSCGIIYGLIMKFVRKFNQ